MVPLFESLGHPAAMPLSLWTPIARSRICGLPLRTMARALSSEDREWGSEKMKQLAKALLGFKAPPGRFGNLLMLPPPAGVQEGGKVEPSLPEDLDQFPPSKRAGVLLCLFLDKNSDVQVILTKRTSTLSTHSGEVALPGGKKDESDANEIETALREAREEIGLEPKLVRVVAQLEPFISKFMIRIVPIVGLLPHRNEFVPKINHAEVESMFEAPLEMFLKEKNHDAKEQMVFGVPVLVHSFDFGYNGQSYRIFGATAAMLIRAASIVFGRQPEFSCSIRSSKI